MPTSCIVKQLLPKSRACLSERCLRNVSVVKNYQIVPNDLEPLAQLCIIWKHFGRQRKKRPIKA